MDPLSDVLSLLKPQSHVSAGFDAGGDWAIAFPGNIGIKCYAVVSGACTLVVEGVADPVRLEGGDCFLLPSGRAFRLCSDPAVAPVEASTVFPPPRAGGVVTYNGGGDVFLVGSRFTLGGAHAEILMGMMPPIVHIKKESDQAALRWSVEHMMQELREPRPGHYLVAQHLAHLMLIQALRMHMAEGPRGGVGWLFALADRQMGAAVGAIHADPSRKWTLAELASQAGMSRSSFALKFKLTVGAAPMDYLTRWRMLLAGDRLAHSNEAISRIALSLGYESESAFSTAFKRVMGCAPRQYGRAEVQAAE
ncbi:AraC family transcriptional regulator [Dongia sp.]|uniref:AraC family transcriptional regulator n=1 Tax=Dongia sp. TaxID=1977262 RepID=UPI003750039A